MEQIELFIAHQFPDMISTIAVIVFMVIVMFSLNIWLALACILPIIVGFVVQFSFMFGSKSQRRTQGILRCNGKYQHIIGSICAGYALNQNFWSGLCALSDKFYDDIIAYRDMTTNYADNYEPCYVLFRVFVLSLSAFIIPVGMLFLTGNPQEYGICYDAAVRVNLRAGNCYTCV